MTTFTGNDGSIEISATAIAELVSFEFTETAERIKDTVLGDTAHTYKTSLPDASGSLVCRYDKTDTAQEALTVGANVTLVLRPTGDTVGQEEITVPVVITSTGGATALDEIVDKPISWEATGPLVRAAIT